MSINYAATPTIRQDASLAAEWEERLTLPDYDRFAQAGMVMTEKQGGSDLRANTTVAEPAGDGWYELTGHKWFCTHPVFEVFLTLGQAPGGITCFVAERPHPGFRLQRLKDKLGGRCLASERGRVRPPARAHPRRRGPRHGVHDRADRLDPDRHDGRRRGDDAAAAERGGLAHAPPQCVRRNARVPARDGQRARGPRARGGGRRGCLVPRRARLRRGRPHVRAHGARGHEVLDLQARRTVCGRGARVPGRERLHRDAAGAGRAVLPRHPDRHGVGGIRQRDRARRAARDGAGARERRRVHGRVRVGTRGGPAPRRAPRPARAPRSTTSPAPSRSSPPARWSRTWRSRCRDRCWCATGPRRWPMLSAPRGWAGVTGPSGRCRPAWTLRRSWTARSRPNSSGARSAARSARRASASAAARAPRTAAAVSARAPNRTTDSHAARPSPSSAVA